MKPIDQYKLMVSPEEVRKHELTHYGVLGMKWGVRHEVGPNGLVNRSTQQSSHKKVKGLMEWATLAVSVAIPTLIWTALTAPERKAAAEAARDGDELEKLGRDLTSLDHLPPGPQPQPQPIAADARVINPEFDSGDFAYQSNCTNCAYAYEMRRRGYDVKALPRVDGRSTSDILAMYQGVRLEKVSRPGDPQSVIEKVKRWGDNARGSVLIEDRDGNKHIFSVEVQSGKVTFVDAQVGKTSPDGKFNFKYGGKMQTADSFGPDTMSTTVFRTDNLKLTKTGLRGVRTNDKWTLKDAGVLTFDIDASIADKIREGRDS